MVDETPKPDGVAGAAEEPPPGGRVPATPYESWQQQFSVDGAALGRRVRELRGQRGWTLKDLRHASGVSQATLSDLENGKTLRPSPVVQMALAAAFRVGSPGALLGLPAPQPLPAEDTGPGPMTLEKLVESLLRGIWAAQGTRGPEGAPERVAPAVVPGVLPAGTTWPDVLAGVPGGTPVFVGAVFLVEPKTVG